MPQLKKAEEFIKKNALIAPGETVIAAFSGGADSVCMLHILYTLSPVLGFKLTAAHVNHMLRPEAETEAAFAKAFCEERKIPFYMKSVDVGRFAAEQKISEEDAGRRVRYEYFDQLLQQLGADKIATAHNKNDNAETVLLHLLRGSGTDGLQGILRRRGEVIRPILNLTRTEVEAYCQSRGLSFVTDQSNLSTEYTRNKLRLELLPLLQKEFNPNLVESLGNLSEIAAADRNFLDQCTQETAKRLIQTGRQGDYIETDALRQLHPSMQRRLLMQMAKDAGCSPEAKHLFALLSPPESGSESKSLDIPGGRAEISCKKLYFFRKNTPKTSYSYSVFADTDLYIPEAGLNVKAYPPGEAEGILLPKDVKIELRSRKNGDKISSGGMTKKISDLLIDQKIPKQERSAYPVLTVDGKPICLIGVRQGDNPYENNSNVFVLNIKREEQTNEK